MYEFNIKHGTGLVIVMHGLGGAKEQPLLSTLGECFSNQTVVVFDSKFTLTKKYNGMSQANYSNYCSDLEDFITYAKTQNWYTEPFTLVGHSLGGFACAKFAQINPDKVNALVMAAPAVDGKMRLATYSDEDVARFEKNNIMPFESFYGTGQIEWNQLKADLETQTILDQDITVPTLLVIAEGDDVVPKSFHDALAKVIVSGTTTVITHCRHGFSTNFKDLQQEITRWIASQNKSTK